MADELSLWALIRFSTLWHFIITASKGLISNANSFVWFYTNLCGRFMKCILRWSLCNANIHCYWFGEEISPIALSFDRLTQLKSLFSNYFKWIFFWKWKFCFPHSVPNSHFVIYNLCENKVSHLCKIYDFVKSYSNCVFYINLSAFIRKYSGIQIFSLALYSRHPIVYIPRETS